MTALSDSRSMARLAVPPTSQGRFTQQTTGEATLTGMAPRETNLFTVVGTTEVAPHMTRLDFKVRDFTKFASDISTDAYVKLQFPTDDADTPILRTYTVHSIDPDTSTASIDFVVHGDEGVAGPWAAAAAVGDEIEFFGPGGGYSPSPEADWHLLVADDTAVPALTSALENLVALEAEGITPPVEVIIESADPQRELPATANTRIQWIASGETPGDAMVEAVEKLEWFDGVCQPFVHGEAHAVMKRIRPILVNERGVSRRALSVSGYWRVGRSEENFREWKRENKPED